MASFNYRLALIVVDMLVDLVDQNPVLSSQRGRLAAGINQLTHNFRKCDQPVICVRQEFKPDLSDAFIEMRKCGVRVTIAGTEGSQILPELVRSETDQEIVKKRYSVLFERTSTKS